MQYLTGAARAMGPAEERLVLLRSGRLAGPAEELKDLDAAVQTAKSRENRP